MKKFLIILLAVFLIVFCAACGTYTPPIYSDNTDTTTKPNEPDNTGTPGGNDEDEEKLLFTVTLICNGQRFSPPQEKGKEIKAQWSNEMEIHSAEFSASGVANTYDCNGDYRVTLSNLPDSYTYDPNAYSADNEHRNVIITLLKIEATPKVGKCKDYYESFKITKLGTYRAIITGSDLSGGVYFGYEPQSGGTFKVQSWVDIHANEVSPKFTHWVNSNPQYQNPYGRRDLVGGGDESTYTKNFKFTLTLSMSEVGNGWTFCIWADVSSGKYPVTVDFTIQEEEPYVPDIPDLEIVEANGRFNKTQGDGNWRWNYEDTNNLLDGSRFKLNWDDVNGDGIYDEAEEYRDANGNGQYDLGERFTDSNGNGIYDYGDGGTGFYHLYDEELYSSNDGYGPLLFVKITQPTEVLKFALSDNTSALRFAGKDYSDFIDKYMEKDKSSKTNDFLYINSDGAHPVNPELKEFLQGYAINQVLFKDGMGVAEKWGLFSAEANQWLFACGYYPSVWVPDKNKK